MILTEKEINKISGGSVDYFDRIVFARAIESALLEKLRGGVELPEAFAHAAYEEHPSYEGVGDIVYYHPNAKPANCIDLFTRRQLLQYGAAQRLAGREGEAVAPSAILARGRFHAFKGEDGEPDDWEWFEEGTNCEQGCIDAVIVRADAIAAPQPAQPSEPAQPEQGPST